MLLFFKNYQQNLNYVPDFQDNDEGTYLHVRKPDFLCFEWVKNELALLLPLALTFKKKGKKRILSEIDGSNFWSESL